MKADALPGWTFRSAEEGWWTRGGDEQLYVSYMDLGRLAAGTSAAERAQLLASVFRETSRRQGTAPLWVDANDLARQVGRPVSCIMGVNAEGHAHVFSCGIGTDHGPALGIEYTSYRDDSLEVIDARARATVARAIAAAIGVD